MLASALLDQDRAGRGRVGISPALPVTPLHSCRYVQWTVLLKFKFPLVDIITSVSFSLKGGCSYILGFLIALVLHKEEFAPVCCTRREVLSFTI